MSNLMRDTALAYAAKGKPVFPCTCEKKPITKGGFKDASTDPELIESWWTKTPGASIGIPTGAAAGFFVLDVDMPDGPAALARLEKEHGPLPATLEQRTGSGGRHLFFKMPDKVTVKNSAGKLGHNLDIRGDGGYVILAPSSHPSGTPYAFINKLPPAEAPAWLLERIVERPTPKQPAGGLSEYGGSALARELADLTGCKEGERNHRLNQAAFSMGQLIAGGELDHGQVEAALLAAAIAIGLPEVEARRTIASGMAAGALEPRTAPPPPGESGERGEKPCSATKTARLKPGESRLILEAAQMNFLLEKARKALPVVGGKAPDYPIAALGPLADACTTLAIEGQVAPEMAGQCLLATAALLVQSMANVRTLAGIKPLSLYLETVADSGDGKSTVEEAALRPIKERQKKEGRAYRQVLDETRREAATREKGVKCPILGPPEPYRIMKDGTVEGIRRAFKEGIASQGCFTSEAAVILGGYGMSAEHRGKSAGNLNGLWDDGEISVARGTEGRLQLYDRRFSMHWLIQPEVAYHAIHDPMLSSIGFWPRFLLACPPPSPPLLARRFEPENFSVIRAFWNRCEQLLDMPLGEDCAGLTVIPPTAEAEKLACRFFEKMQVEAKTAGGGLTGVKPFAVRAVEQAFRVAGVQAVFADKHEIDVKAMRHGIALAAYSLEAWRACFGDKDENAARSWALALYEWLLKQKGQQATAKAMLQIISPKHMRTQHRRDTALALLQQGGLVDRDQDTWFAVIDGVAA